MEAECCRNCKNAWKRDHHDFEYYGSRGYPFECCIASENSTSSIYRKPTDICRNFEQREES